jgi:Zn finger protein HypA/HybF involved in hydrogenase expression
MVIPHNLLDMFGGLRFTKTYLRCIECRHVALEEDFKDGCPKCSCLSQEQY